MNRKPNSVSSTKSSASARQPLAAFDELLREPPRALDGLRAARVDAGRSPTPFRPRSHSATRPVEARHAVGTSRMPAACRRASTGEAIELGLRACANARRRARATSPPRQRRRQRFGCRLSRRGSSMIVGSRMLTACRRSSSCVRSTAPLERGRRAAGELRPEAASSLCSARPVARRADRVRRRSASKSVERRRRGLRAASVDDRRRVIGGDVSPDPQRQQVAGQVAAVDGRDVGRRQRRQRARVVPVVEVPAIALQRQQRVEGRLQPIDDAGRS